MRTPTGYIATDIDDERRGAMHQVDQWAFAVTHADSVLPHIDACVPWSRARGIEVLDGEDAGMLAAVHASYGHTMRVPGGVVPTSGLTWVGVHPSHRRRGLLRAMIADHFARSRERGEAVSTLFAAESAIYQRFGYGLGCWGYQLTLGRGVAARPVPGASDLRVRLEDADLAKHGGIVREVLARDPRPGVMVDFDDDLLAGIFVDPPEWRGGKERRRIAIVEDHNGPVAFALFQRESIWEDSQPRGKGWTKAWAAATATGEMRLWSVLADLDLMASFVVPAAPVDSALLLLADDPRGMRGQLRDQLWVRILDLPTALEARTYSHDIALTFEVIDPLIAENAHVWRIEVLDGAARVERAPRDGGIDLRINIQELGAAYLGATNLTALHHAGLIEELHPGTVSELSLAMSAPLAPRAPWVF